ncbi:MAG: BamA/TamA family outer membrane protein, partial [Bacteroidota bacterium]
QWRPFNAKLGRTHWATYNAFLFDQSFLTKLNWQQWQEAVLHLQSTLLDDVIDNAFTEAWPEPFLSRDAPSIKATIKGRRDQLMAIAKDYYLFLAKNVDVLGTDQKDFFLIERLNDQQTRVRVYELNKNRDKEGLFYDRIFRTEETQNIYCYGLGDDDIFEVRGAVGIGPRTHLIGGEGKDQFDDQSITSLDGRQVFIYDFLTEDNELIHTNDSRDRRSKHPENNLYDRRSTAYQHNFNSVLPLLGFNPDDRLFLGFAGRYTRYGFQKTPFASEHEYGGLVSASTGGLSAYYRGNFTHVIGQLGLQFAIKGQTPLYANNFYGLGNETINLEEEKGLDFHRIRKAEAAASLRLAWRPNQQTNLWIGPSLIHYDLEQTAGRFLDSFVNEVPQQVVDDVNYLKLGAEFNYKNTNDVAFPTRGIGLFVDADYHVQLDDDDFNFPSINAELQLYQQIDNRGKLVFATQLGVQHRFSDDFPFFLGARLGGLGPDGNLRGFRRDRFTGRTAFYHNTDLRWKLGYWNNNAIPMALGLTASFDYGKVSLEDIESDIIHYSYGGGVFFSPFDLVTVHVGSYKLPTADGDDLRWLVGGGFFF